jgi:hypothetical protein
MARAREEEEANALSWRQCGHMIGLGRGRAWRVGPGRQDEGGHGWHPPPVHLRDVRDWGLGREEA